MDKITIPTYLGSTLHFYPVCMHLPGATTWGWERIQSPKKIILFSDAKPGGQEDRPWTSRPILEEALRWFDYWLKGVDNGIMKEPPVKIWVRGSDSWRFENEWPLLSKTEWKKYYLSNNHRLTENPDVYTEIHPDVLEYKYALPVIYGNLPISNKPDILVYSMEFDRDVTIIGPMCLNLFATLSTEDGDFIVVIKDVGPDGISTTLTRGWLKASHRDLDQDKSRAWRPHHPHVNPRRVIPGEVTEFAIEIQPIANIFRQHHRLQLEIWPCDWYDPREAYDWTLFWGLVQHIPYGKDITYKIFHSKENPSHLLIPEITK
jgi:uncharacterized protein